MEYELKGNVMKMKRVLSDLDNFVLSFVDIFNSNKISYVVISGHVAILFGRTRATEDIDIFIEKIDRSKFASFLEDLGRWNYWVLSTTDPDDTFKMLENGLAIRIAKTNTAIHNFEIKFPKKDTDFLSLSNPLKVVMNDKELLTSPLEIQIAFKFWLGGDKDIEDGTHLYELFKKDLNNDLLNEMGRKLNVTKKMMKYGIE